MLNAGEEHVPGHSVSYDGLDGVLQVGSAWKSVAKQKARHLVKEGGLFGRRRIHMKCPCSDGYLVG